MLNIDDVISKLEEYLPHNYKRKDSNVQKLIEIFKRELNNFNNEKDEVYDGLDIDKATGLQLDRIGGNVGETRKGRDDVNYRKVLKVIIRANVSGGDIPTINEVGKVLVGDSYIGVSELYYQDKYGNEPAAIVVALDYQKAFEEISEEYEDIDNDPWYLDGEYDLDGERNLDGGINFGLSERLEDIYELLESARTLVKRVVAGGVRVYIELPDWIETTIDIEHETELMLNNETNQIIEINYSSQQEIISQTEQSSVNVLDGSTKLDGSYNLGAERDSIIHNVEIQEAVA